MITRSVLMGRNMFCRDIRLKERDLESLHNKRKGRDKMFCNQCGKELADGSKFCKFCGSAARSSVSAEGGVTQGAGMPGESPVVPQPFGTVSPPGVLAPGAKA